MKILFLCHRFPYPPSGGAQIRAFHMIRHLARNHEVVVGSMVRSEEEAQQGRDLLRHCARYYAGRVGKWMPLLRMVGNLATPTPSSMGYFFSPDLKRWVDAELARGGYDLILVYCSSMAPYVAKAKGVPMILDFVDMDAQKWLLYAGTKPFPLSLGYRLEGRKLLRAEKAMARRFDICTTATPFETATLDGYGTGCRSATFGNGVDFDYFAPATEPYDPDSVVFLGRMNYFPNSQCMVDFCADVLPLLLERRPSTRLTIVGADPTPAVVRLGEHPAVTVTGSVPDVRPYLRGAAVSVAPLAIARGTQNKILESLATGVPCVCSRLAAGGVHAVDGEHLLACDTPEEYAAAILRLLDDPAERARFADAGRARMLTHHNWDASMAVLDDLVAAAVGREGAVAAA